MNWSMENKELCLLMFINKLIQNCLFLHFCHYHLFTILFMDDDRLCGLVVRVLGYRSGGPSSIPGTTRKKKVVGLKRGPLNFVSTTEELLDRKVAAPV
jgi:hypothetical protein